MIRRVALIALVGLVVVAGIWYVAFWGPENSQLKTARSHEAQAETNVLSLGAQLAAIRAQVRQLPSERATLALLNQAVPEGPSLDELLNTITAAAAKAHVGLTSIGTPAPTGWGTTTAAAAAAAGPPTITLSVGINVISNVQILEFITALEAQPRLYVVDSFALQSLPGTGSLASDKGSGKLRTGHRAGSSAASKTDAGLATSVTVQAFYVSASSNDPAALNVSFAAPGGPKKSKAKSGASATSPAEMNAAAKAAALHVLLAEQTYERSTGGYLSSASKAAARVLGDANVLSASATPEIAGRVAATAGDYLQSAWIPVAATETGRALLVESLAKSGTCFYIADFLKGATYAEAYAETTGGCTSDVAFPSGTLGTSARVVASSSGVHAGDWSGTW